MNVLSDIKQTVDRLGAKMVVCFFRCPKLVNSCLLSGDSYAIMKKNGQYNFKGENKKHIKETGRISNYETHIFSA